MVEEVINSLENMKLPTEEEEVIAISEEGRQEEIESCVLSLIGKILTCKPFNKKATQNTLEELGGGMRSCKLSRWGQTYSNLNSDQSLRWSGYGKVGCGHLIIKF